MEGGEQLAHALGSEHPDYTPDATQAMWDRKVREREERGLGWPGCEAFENAGCTFCKTCQHCGKIKSSLHLALSPAQLPKEQIVEQFKEEKIDPIVALKQMHQQGIDNATMFAVLNEAYAVVKYGGQIVIASTSGDDISFLKVDDFHKMFANLRVQQGRKSVEVSKLWFEWSGRRQYLGRGIVFEPGGPLDVTDDMLNLWRGFAIEPKKGDWPLMRSHLLNVVCSGNQAHFDYLIRWMALAVQRSSEPSGVAVAFQRGTGGG